MRRRQDLDIVRVRATDFVEMVKSIIDDTVYNVVLLSRDNKFCLLSRTSDKEIVWVSEWKHTLNEADTCKYMFPLNDLLTILDFIPDHYYGFLSFIFTKDGKLTRVATSQESLWFKYSNKI